MTPYIQILPLYLWTENYDPVTVTTWGQVLSWKETDTQHGFGNFQEQQSSDFHKVQDFYKQKFLLSFQNLLYFFESLVKIFF